MSKQSTSRISGFTVIELVVVIAFLATAAIFLFIQRNDLVASNKDTERKTAVNAMYYSLEKVYYPANNSYPEKVTSAILPSVDPTLFIDTNGKKPGDNGFEYRYTATGCSSGACKNFTLSVNLQKEAQYTKQSNR